MELDKDAVIRIVRDTLTPEQLARSLVFWDKRVHEDGERIQVGLETVPMPFRGTMVFVDLAPSSNWAHPCLYIFIDSRGEKTHLLEASFPPAIGTAEGDYIIPIRSGDFAQHER